MGLIIVSTHVSENKFVRDVLWRNVFTKPISGYIYHTAH